MRTTATLDEPSRLNMIGRLEQERQNTVGKITAHESGYRWFLLKNLNYLIGFVQDHRDVSQFLHSREGYRSGLVALKMTLDELDWMLAELKQQSAEYQSESTQLEAA